MIRLLAHLPEILMLLIFAGGAALIALGILAAALGIYLRS